MAITTSMFIPGNYEIPNSFKVSTLYGPVVPYNEEALQVFENDKHAHFFSVGPEEYDRDSSVVCQRHIPYFSQEKILNLKSNNFPEDLVSLESSFTRNDGIKVETPK